MRPEGERLSILETQMDNIEKKVDRGFDSIKQSQDELSQKLDDFIDKADGKFAPKWVEKAVWGGAAVVGTAVILAILEQIFS